MPESFFQRLASYYQSLGEILRAERKLSSVLPNPADLGWVRETRYSRILSDHLPAGCNILFGGFLFDSEGNESKQVDIIVCSDTVPQFKVENKSFASVDGTIATFEIKSTLTKDNFISSLESFASLPNTSELADWQLAGIDEARNYHHYPFKAVFAYSGLGIEEIKSTLRDFYTENSHIPYTKKPDLIHVCGSCTFHKGLLSPEREQMMLEEGMSQADIEAHKQISGYPDANDILGFCIAFSRIQEVTSVSRNILFDTRYILNKMLHFV